jgi:GLPGLI family protein
MKSFITLLLTFVTLTTFAQRDFQGKATYMYKRTVDMEAFGQMSEQQKKQRMERMKSFLEKTFTLNFNKTESSFKEEVSLEAPGSSGGRSWGRSNGQGSIYKNVSEKKLIEDKEMFSKRFLIVEDMEIPKWEMSAETKKIGSYTAYKATMIKVDTSIDWAGMFGRGKKKDSTSVKEKEEIKTILVTAWYTPQIPVSAGPEEYWGLPGLILELNSGRETMLCTEVVINPTEAIKIEKPTKGDKVTREEYTKIINVKTQELKERFQNRGRGGNRRF